MICKIILSFAASIIKLFIFSILITKSVADENIKKFSNDEGILSIMYHRFNESKYPSTNIDMEIFRKHVEMIKNNNFQFYNPKNFENEFYSKKNDKKILLTIDDAFTSFYKNAWPYLKKNKIENVTLGIKANETKN